MSGPSPKTTRRVYGPTTQKRWLYADSKAMDEFLALAYKQERGLDCVIVRLFNTVGPRQSGQYGMVIPRFVQQALSGGPIEIHGDGTQTRSFCHVSDTIRALKGLMDERSISGEIFNVGSTGRIRIVDLAERIRALAQSESELVFVPYDEVYEVGIEDTLHREPAIEKITAAIGWQPTIDLDGHPRRRHLSHAGDSGAKPDLTASRHGLAGEDRAGHLDGQIARQRRVRRGRGRPRPAPRGGCAARASRWRGRARGRARAGGAPLPARRGRARPRARRR